MNKISTEILLIYLKDPHNIDQIDFNKYNLTEKQFEILSNHRHWKARNCITKHSNLPENLIYKLANDEDYRVRLNITKRYKKLPKDLIYKLSEDENVDIRWKISLYSDLPDDLIIRLCCDWWGLVHAEAFERLEKINSLKLEDFQNAYDLIRESKHIYRENFKKIFDYIAEKFPELSELAKMFKRIILKGKRDL